MPLSTFLPLGLSVLMFSAAGQALAHDASAASTSKPFLTMTTIADVDELHCLEPTESPFPTQAMATEFAAYLRWTKAEGLSRLAAFKALADPAYAGGVELPTEQMAEQFRAYLDWTERQGLSRFHAFNVTNFD